MSDTPKPVQADPREPHWLVVSMRGKDEMPQHGKRPWRYLFRHPTLESADTECARLAGLIPGTRFTVYASGPSHKVELVPAPEYPVGAEDVPAAFEGAEP